MQRIHRKRGVENRKNKMESIASLNLLTYENSEFRHFASYFRNNIQAANCVSVMTPVIIHLIPRAFYYFRFYASLFVLLTFSMNGRTEADLSVDLKLGIRML